MHPVHHTRLAILLAIALAAPAAANDSGEIWISAQNTSEGHFYRLDMTTDTLTEDTSYGPIASGIHGLIVSADETRAYITAPGAEEVKVLNLNGSDVGTLQDELLNQELFEEFCDEFTREMTGFGWSTAPASRQPSARLSASRSGARS